MPGRIILWKCNFVNCLFYKFALLLAQKKLNSKEEGSHVEILTSSVHEVIRINCTYPTRKIVLGIFRNRQWWWYRKFALSSQAILSMHVPFRVIGTEAMQRSHCSPQTPKCPCDSSRKMCVPRSLRILDSSVYMSEGHVIWVDRRGIILWLHDILDD